MRALVTGGAGFIGSAIARRLIADGADVRVVDNFVTGAERNLPEGVDLLRGDIRDPAVCARACDGIEVVFHQAALRSVAKSVEEPVPTAEVNIAGTLNMLEAATAAGVRRFVNASSSSVYGDAGDVVEREDDRTHPLSPYAVSKLAAEQYCRIWSSLHGLSTVSLRYFNVFGPGQARDSQYAAVFPAFVSALAAGEAPEVHWDGEQCRDFCYVDDVVAANLAAADASDEVSGAVINIAGGHPRTINEILRAIADAAGTWIEPRRVAKRAGDIRNSKADLSRAAELLGWKPEADWADGVAATVRWFTDGVRS